MVYSSNLRSKVLALIQIFKSQGVMADELNILVLGHIALGVVSKLDVVENSFEGCVSLT